MVRRPSKDPVHSWRSRRYSRAGKRLERTVAEALEVILAWLNLPDVRVVLVSHAPYDVELIRGRRRAFVEVKGSTRYDWLVGRVSEAFRREHPEPFCVVGVLGYPRAAESLLSGRAPAWIWTGPGRDGRLGSLTRGVVRRWLRQAGLL